MSLNPVRETLEDFFVRQIGAAPTDRGSGAGGAMRIIGHVAVNVFKESVRDKVLYNLVAFACC